MDKGSLNGISGRSKIFEKLQIHNLSVYGSAESPMTDFSILVEYKPRLDPIVDPRLRKSVLDECIMSITSLPSSILISHGLTLMMKNTRYYHQHY